MKERMNKFISLWQSQDKKYENMYLSSWIFLFASLFSFGFMLILENDNKILNSISMGVFIYLGVFSFFLAIWSWLVGFYVNNSCIKLKQASKLVFVAIVLMLIVTLIIGIPFFVVVVCLDKIVQYRAKKHDNIINLIIVMVLLLCILTSLLYFDYWLCQVSVDKLSCVMGENLEFYINVSATKIFAMITLLIGETYISMGIMLLIQRCVLERRNKKIIEKEKKIAQERAELNVGDIKKYMEEKENNEKELEKKYKILDKELEYDINYIKNSILRSWLAILIVAFVIVTFGIVPNQYTDAWRKYQSDIINVITVYTLILLYIDKRKEWK